MHNDELDRILSSEEEIRPSPLFAAKVMQAVYREADTPQPIAFPWKRALPGLAAAVISIGMGSAMGPVDIPSSWINGAAHVGIPWILLALFVVWVALAGTRRLASH